MAIQKVVMPQMGESITNGTITKWHKAPGDKIEIDEILLEISTDKVESEIPSPFEGRLENLLAQEGDTIDVGVTIAEIQDDLSAAASAAPEASAPTETAAEATPAQTPAQAAPAQVSTPAPSNGSNGSGRRFYTPLVRAMAKEAGVELSQLEQVEGTGAGGRVTRDDFLKFMGSGPSVSSTPATSSPAPAAAVASPAPVQQGQVSGRTEVIPMDNMRKAIAKNMVLSKQTSPHVNSIGEVDLTHLVKFREGFKNEFQKQEGFKLTYTHFIAKALVDALREYPYVNASIEGDNIVLKKDINLGLAVAVPGKGLVVPVIKGADGLNMLGLCRALNDMALKARDKKVTLEDLTGGTFTFTNNGNFGVEIATPVILQPQVGIYASGTIKKKAVVVNDDAIAVRSMMYGCHSYDHRLIDGEMGGKFLMQVHQNLMQMDPAALF